MHVPRSRKNVLQKSDINTDFYRLLHKNRNEYEIQCD